MNQLKFGVPVILPPKPFTIEIELPYRIANEPYLIKISAAESLVESWVEADKNILATIEEYAQDYIADKLNQQSLNDHEYLILQ